MTKKISVVVPVYYNEKSLAILFNRLQTVEKELQEKQISLELIFVDDGSQDNSFDELMKIKSQCSDVKIIKLTRNFGAIHASKTGCRFVTGDAFVILAADLQDPPELILQMVDAWLKGSKFTIGVRATREDSFLTRGFATCYYFLLRLMVDKTYPKGGFDMALMDKTLLPYLVNSSKNIYTPLYLYWLGFKPTILHYDRPKRIHGKSMWTITKKIKTFLDALLGFSVIPIRLISLIGFFVALISFGYGLNIVIHALLGAFTIPGYATVVCLIAFLLGLIIMMLGVIGEYLWRIFSEVNHQPEVIIDEIY